MDGNELMLPVYIICHADCEPAAYLCHFFEKKNILYKKINAIQTRVSELDLTKVAGLIFMGGSYSVNDELPWQSDEIKFIQKAIEKNILIMGVCLGAQLISKALNAKVSKADKPEIGWYHVSVDTSQLADLQPLNLQSPFEVFEWHEDKYFMPEDAIPIFTSDSTMENQGYLYGGRVLVMQFHLEMTEHLVCEWLDRYKKCLPQISSYAQSPEQITQGLTERLDTLHANADIIYDWWLHLEKPTGH